MKKTILLGITSSIAIYKSVQLVSDLLKKGYDVEVIMSDNATRFIAPLTFSTLTKHKTYVHTFDREIDYQVEHISLAKKADVFMIVPATANVIAKIAHGIADDMLTTTFLASTCPKLIAPAMNVEMYKNSITQENLEICRKHAIEIVEPVSGLLACGDEGIGKLADIDTLIEYIESALTIKDLHKKNILISAGPTIEAIDPVRFLSNHSSGKMGYALAKIAKFRGANVTLISGPTTLKVPNGINFISVTNASDMAKQMLNHYEQNDFVIMSAAVSDYTFTDIHPQKIKKTEDVFTLQLVKTIDILAELGTRKTHQLLCGFAMETEDLIVNAKAKFIKKHCDLLVANNLNDEQAGFGYDTNKVSLITQNQVRELPLLSKEEVAMQILNTLKEMENRSC